MKARRWTAVTALGLAMVAGSASPAAAAAGGPLVITTGLTSGQLIGAKQFISPTFDPRAATVELLVNGVLLVRQARTAGAVLLQPPVELNNAEADVTIRAYDLLGAVTELSTRVRVDTEPPQATFTPGWADRVHGNTTITATEPSADLADFVVTESEGGRLVGRATAAPWSVTWIATGQNGRLTLALTDLAGNSSTARTAFKVDDQGPLILQILPAERAFVHGTTLTTSVLALDLSGIKSATLVGAPAITTPPYTVTVPIGGDGARVLTWRLADRWDNLSTERRTVIVDNTLPTISITAPKSGTRLSGTLTVPVKVADLNGIDRVEMRVNGRTKATDITPPYSLQLHTGEYGSSYSVAFYVFDKAGNASSTKPRTYLH
ncbi:Ig-like domain-containing protein [Actinoplanes sp. NPDC049265]|uniref:Ig-like domain-containing protein n=1 Tax=Actinoplanes sp. NPDC049265 TaxID=3363902 RepID=UPI003711A5B6